MTDDFDPAQDARDSYDLAVSEMRKRHLAKSQPQRPRAAHNWYMEPGWCVDILLDAEQPQGTILDPACGAGTIVKACRSRGLAATGSDIVDRGFGKVQGFLDPQASFPGIDVVLTNPPYDAKTTPAFLERALTVARDRVILLLPLPFLASERRHALFNDSPLARVWVLSSRPSMPPGELLTAGKIKATGGKEDYCWIVWQHGWRGSPQVGWLRKPKVTK